MLLFLFVTRKKSKKFGLFTSSKYHIASAESFISFYINVQQSLNFIMTMFHKFHSQDLPVSKLLFLNPGFDVLLEFLYLQSLTKFACFTQLSTRWKQIIRIWKHLVINNSIRLPASFWSFLSVLIEFKVK